MHDRQDGSTGLPDDLEFEGDTELDRRAADLAHRLDAEDAGDLAEDFGLPFDMRAMEQSIAQIESYLVERGVEPTDERQAKIGEIIGDGSWLLEPVLADGVRLVLPPPEPQLADSRVTGTVPRMATGD